MRTGIQNRFYFLFLGCLFLLSACTRAPSVDILGSFFPAWIICCFVGIVLAIITYFIFARLGLHAAIPLQVLTYPCLAASYTFLTWLIFYS